MRKVALVVVIVGSLLALAGTAGAGFFLRGGRNAKTDPSTVIAKYAIEPCVMIADGSSAGAPEVEYWLFDDTGKLAIFERMGPGDGSIFENHWTDADGDHFFVWVRGSHGFEVVLPEDRSADGDRLVYAGGTYQGKNHPSGARIPVGSPAARCVLKATYVAVDRSPAAAPSDGGYPVDFMDELEQVIDQAVEEAFAEAEAETAVEASAAPRPDATESAPAPASRPKEPSPASAPAPAVQPSEPLPAPASAPEICLRFSAVGSRGAKESEWTCSNGLDESPAVWIGDDSGYRRQQLRIRTSGPDEVCIRHSAVGSRGPRESAWACSRDGVPSDWIGLGDDSGYRRQQLGVKHGGPHAVCLRFTKVGRRGPVESGWSCSGGDQASEWIPLSDDSGYRNQRLWVLVEP